jgi:hypothetical protein
MLRVLGSPRKLCDGWTRRDLLQAGGLGMFGLGLADFLRLSEAQAAPAQAAGGGFGKAKSCILLYLYGAPSQLELCDMKPDAPPEVRGELKPIRSRLPGCDVCELLPNFAKVMDRVSVVRSMTHPYPIHGVAFATTGIGQIELNMELNPRDPRHWPFVGSVVDYLGRQGKRKKKADAAPDNIALPFPFSSQRRGEVARAGPYAAFLGGAFNPIWTSFHGTANGRATKALGAERFETDEPYVGITRDSGFELAGATNLPADLTLNRLDGRRSLLEQFDQARKLRDNSSAARANDRYREMAYELIGSAKVRQALDIQREPLPVRESYGMTLFGQGCLAARRLVEAGSRFVSVFWDEFGLAGSAWDTHQDHYPRMRHELMPGLDRAFYGLIQDLDSRGLLDETLVMLVSEHGRTPKLASVPGGGRDHWSRAYTNVFAGGGVARGRVIGRTDKIGGDVAERPVSPKDVLATTYHLLGIDPQTMLTDRIGRPLPLVADGEVIADMLA